MSFGRMYSATFSNAVTAQQDLWMIAPATNIPIKIHALFISQTSEPTTEEEQLRIAVIRGNATVGTGGAAVTPVPVNPGDPAATATVRRGDTTVASAGTPVTLHEEAMNIRIGYPLILPPEMQWGCSAAQTRICVRLLTTPADSITMLSTIYYRALP